MSNWPEIVFHSLLYFVAVESILDKVYPKYLISQTQRRSYKKIAAQLSALALAVQRRRKILARCSWLADKITSLSIPEKQ